MRTNSNKLGAAALLLVSLAFAPQALAAPGNQAAPVVTGAPVVGSTLVADSGDWSGVSGDLTLSYDWQLCSDSADLATCESVGAADSASYAVGASDRSQSVRVVVTATDSADAGSPVSAAAAPVGPVAGPAFAGALPTLSIADARAGEADGELVFTVSLSAPTTRTVTVAYTTADGSAQAGADYTAAAGSVTFFAGERSRTIAVTIGRDAAAEGDETLTVSLTGALNAVVEDVSATGTIADATPQAAGSPSATAVPVAPAAPVAGVVRAPASALTLLLGTAGDDRIEGTPGNDTIAAGAGSDAVSGLAGSDRLAGDEGDDVLRGGTGDDTIVGGAGSDTIVGGAGSDTIRAADGERDVVSCGAGRDRAFADGDDVLIGCELVKVS